MHYLNSVRRLSSGGVEVYDNTESVTCLAVFFHLIPQRSAFKDFYIFIALSLYFLHFFYLQVSVGPTSDCALLIHGLGQMLLNIFNIIECNFAWEIFLSNKFCVAASVVVC